MMAKSISLHEKNSIFDRVWIIFFIINDVMRPNSTILSHIASPNGKW